MSSRLHLHVGAAQIHCQLRNIAANVGTHRSSVERLSRLPITNTESWGLTGVLISPQQHKKTKETCTGDGQRQQHNTKAPPHGRRIRNSHVVPTQGAVEGPGA